MSLNGRSLNQTIQNLKVLQLEIENKGAGANPLLSSNSANQRLNLDTELMITNRMYWLDGTSFIGELAHNNSANRLYTLPDKALTVADNADITTLKALTLIGSTNKKFINCNYYGEETHDLYRVTATLYQFTFSDAVGMSVFFLLDLPPTLGSLKLYVDSLRMRVLGADADNKIDVHRLEGEALDGSITPIDVHLTDTTSAELRQHDFTVVDCSGYEKVLIEIVVDCDGVADLKFMSPQVRSYYGT